MYLLEAAGSTVLSYYVVMIFEFCSFRKISISPNLSQSMKYGMEIMSYFFPSNQKRDVGGLLPQPPGIRYVRDQL